jgi:hypothetical protein
VRGVPNTIYNWFTQPPCAEAILQATFEKRRGKVGLWVRPMSAISSLVSRH